MAGRPTQIDDYARDDKADNQEDLEKGKYYFRLKVIPISRVAVEELGSLDGRRLTSPYHRTPEKLSTAITTPKTLYHTAALISEFQKLIIVAAATSSAGAVIAIVYQKFQPVAVPRAG